MKKLLVPTWCVPTVQREDYERESWTSGRIIQVSAFACHFVIRDLAIKLVTWSDIRCIERYARYLLMSRIPHLDWAWDCSQ